MLSRKPDARMEKHQELNQKASSVREACSALPSAAAIYASRHSLISCQFPSTAVVCGCNAKHLSPLSPSRPASKLDVQHVAVWESQDSQNWPPSMKSDPSLLLYLLQGLRHRECGFVSCLGPSDGVCEERLQQSSL